MQLILEDVYTLVTCSCADPLLSRCCSHIRILGWRVGEKARLMGVCDILTFFTSEILGDVKRGGINIIGLWLSQNPNELNIIPLFQNLLVLNTFPCRKYLPNPSLLPFLPQYVFQCLSMEINTSEVSNYTLRTKI